MNWNQIKLFAHVFLLVIMISACTKESLNEDRLEMKENYYPPIKNAGMGIAEVLSVDQYDDLMIIVDNGFPEWLKNDIVDAVEEFESVPGIGLSFCVAESGDISLDDGIGIIHGSCSSSTPVSNLLFSFWHEQTEPSIGANFYTEWVNSYSFNHLGQMGCGPDDFSSYKYIARHYIGRALKFALANGTESQVNSVTQSAVSYTYDESGAHHICGTSIGSNETSIMWRRNRTECETNPVGSVPSIYPLTDSFTIWCTPDCPFFGPLSTWVPHAWPTTLNQDDELVCRKLYPSEDCYGQPVAVAYEESEYDSWPGIGDGKYVGINFFTGNESNAYWKEFEIFAIPEYIPIHSDKWDCDELGMELILSQEIKLGSGNPEHCSEDNSISLVFQRNAANCNIKTGNPMNTIMVRASVKNLKRDVIKSEEVYFDLPFSIGCCGSSQPSLIYWNIFEGGDPG